MKRLSLVVTYTKDTFSPTVGIEQEPVADNSLTTDDLINMLALVRSGISAKLYRPDTCDVAVVNGEVLADLIVYTWPKPYDLSYELASNYGELSARVAVTQDREFDFVINLSKQIELPFCVESISYSETQLPFFDNTGSIVESPAITFDDKFVYISSEVIGVIRIKCRAKGHQRTLSLSFAKDDNILSSIDITTSASWKYQDELQTTVEKMELPGCLELLLATCDDDLLREKKYGSFGAKDELIPVVYYSDCDGSFMALRYEKA